MTAIRGLLTFGVEWRRHWRWATMVFCVVSAAARANCDIPPNWIPDTPIPSTQTPPPHPASDCPFYQAAWENFLYATQPDAKTGLPRFLSYPTVADLFGQTTAPQFAEQKIGVLSLAPRTVQFPNDKTPRASALIPGVDAGVSQAGPLRGVLIDQRGNPVYYAIHVNDIYSKFIRQNGLTTKGALLAADSDKVEFPEGAVELKSAWQIVDAKAPPPNYFVTTALVPNLKVQNGDVVEVGTSRQVTVALIAIHVVFVLKTHPEFIWSTFEHLGSNGQGIRDNAPAALTNPPQAASAIPISGSDWTLYRAGTLAGNANIPNSPQDRVNMFDETAQRFVRTGNVLQTSVYRMFPGSKSTDVAEDDEVVGANNSMRILFSNQIAANSRDKRRNYQLVGAIWLDVPELTFHSNVLFQNQDGQSTDAPGAMVAGEDRLSSTAMESFTQSDQGRPNCFSCHNTKRVTDDITFKAIIGPKRLNVSHVLSKFLSESQ